MDSFDRKHTLGLQLWLEDVQPLMGRFLVFGSFPWVEEDLLGRGWAGIAVRNWGYKPRRPEQGDGDLIEIVGQVASEPHLTKVLQGYYIRPVTIPEIWDQFCGDKKIDLLMLNVPDQNRSIWFHEKIQLAEIQTHILPEDGHNEEVEKRAIFCGAIPRMQGDWLTIHKTTRG